MAPFRVVARNPDKDHGDHAWAQVAGPFDYQDDAEAAATPTTAAAERVVTAEPQSLDIGDPVRPDPTRAAAEAAGLGYELKVQELVEDGEDTSKWKDVA